MQSHVKFLSNRTATIWTLFPYNVEISFILNGLKSKFDPHMALGNLKRSIYQVWSKVKQLRNEPIKSSLIKHVQIGMSVPNTNTNITNFTTITTIITIITIPLPILPLKPLLLLLPLSHDDSIIDLIEQ